MARIQLRSIEEIARLPIDEQEKAIELQAAYLQLVTDNPLLRYEPAGPRHAAFHASRARTRALFGGNRSGKTTIGIVQDVIDVSPLELVPEPLRPYKRWDCPCYIRVMTPDMERTMKPVIHAKLKEWMPRRLFKGNEWGRAFDGKSSSLQLECGCRFDFLSYEMALDKFGGAALHRAHFDEEPPAEIRAECLMRLVDYGGDELFTMTPLQGLTWAFERLWQNRDVKPETLYVDRVAIYDNPHLTAAGVRMAEEELADEAGGDMDEVRRRLRGEFVHIGGMVYPLFSSARAPARSAEWVREQEIVVGIDPGLRGAGFCWIAFDRENEPFVFDTVELKDKMPADYVALCRERERKWGLKPDSPLYVIDPAARARNIVTAETIQSVLGRHGLFTANGDNDVDGGVGHTRDLLASSKLKVSDAPECRILFDQASMYRINDRPDGRFEVVKERDHVLDAKRYALMSRPWKPWEEKATLGIYPPDVAQPPPGRGREAPSSIMGALA